MSEVPSFSESRQIRKQLREERKQLKQAYLEIMIKREEEPSLAKQKVYDKELEEISDKLISLANQFLDLRVQMKWRLIKILLVVTAALFVILSVMEHLLV
jgi:hypothetical protein